MKKYNKVSDIVSGQLPNFVGEEYPKFVAFLEAYYRYLETQKINRNIESLRDVDTTLTDFVSLLKGELAHASPSYRNNRLYLPHLKQHFVSRGSEESYDLLFRLLYNKDIELKYPKDSILKVSDGKWYQDHSIFVKLNSGDIGSLKHKYVTIITSNKSIRIHVDKVLVIDETLGVYEVYFSRNYYGEITIGSTLEYNGVNATTLATTSKIKIFKGGKGFRLGQVFSIPSAVGSISQAAIKVSKIGSGGEIKEIQKIDFGVGYANSFYYTISNKEVEAELYSFPITSHIRALEGGGTEIIYQNPSLGGYQDPTSGFADTGFVSRNTYFEHDANIPQADPLYGSGDYVATVETQFLADSAGKIIDEDSAIFLIELGAVAVYPGYYSTTDGFVSGISYIQDGEYYQDFSYIIKVDEKLENYRNAVLQFLHPTGRKLFGEYSIENDFILTIETVLSVIRLRLADLYNTLESVDFIITKPLTDNNNVQTEHTYLDVSKGLITSTLSQPTDSNFYNFGKSLESIQSQPTDSNFYNFGKSLESIQSQPTDSNFYNFEKSLQSVLGQLNDSSRTLSFGKELSDTPLANDLFGYVFTGGRLVEDTLTTPETFSFIPTKNFTESIASTTLSTSAVIEKEQFTEFLINTDTGGLQLDPYYSTDYFSQDYQEGRTSF